MTCDLIDIYRTLRPKAAEYTFFSGTHRTFLRSYQMLGHKTSLSQEDKSNQAAILTTVVSN